MIGTPSQMLLEESGQGRSDGQVLRKAWERREMRTEFRWGNLTEMDQLECRCKEKNDIKVDLQQIRHYSRVDRACLG